MTGKAHHIRNFVVLVWISLLAGCIPDPGYGPVSGDTDTPNLTHPGLLIVNEGGFTFGQGALSFYDRIGDSVYNRVFEAVNDRPLGDVFQSIAWHDGRGYLVVNNSRKIEIVDSLTLESIGTIDGLESPRHVIVADGYIFISDLYSNEIGIIDKLTLEVMEPVPSGGWTGPWLNVAGTLYVPVQQIYGQNGPGARTGLMRIDPVARTETGFAELPQGANSLVQDASGKIWVLCDGGLEEETGGLFRIDPITMAVESAVMLPGIDYSASSLQVDRAGETLYFLLSDPGGGLNDHDLYRMPVGSTSLPDTAWLDGEGRYLYGFYLDEDQDELYCTDAVGLLQEGFLLRYRLSDLTPTGTYRCGIFPGSIYAR